MGGGAHRRVAEAAVRSELEDGVVVLDLRYLGKKKCMVVRILWEHKLSRQGRESMAHWQWMVAVVLLCFGQRRKRKGETMTTAGPFIGGSNTAPRPQPVTVNNMVWWQRLGEAWRAVSVRQCYSGLAQFKYFSKYSYCLDL
jgi:hypothetical protein